MKFIAKSSLLLCLALLPIQGTSQGTLILSNERGGEINPITLDGNVVGEGWILDILIQRTSTYDGNGNWAGDYRQKNYYQAALDDQGLFDLGDVTFPATSHV